jgi:hypothetical protein
VAKDKYDFILDLIENKKLTPSQREWVLRLSVKEMKNDGIEFDERLRKIEEKLRECNFKKIEPQSGNSKLVSSGINTQSQEGNPIIHNPKKTVKLLKYFTSNDKNLKYSTHSWEFDKFSGYDHFMESIEKEWNEIKDELRNQNFRLYAKISSFLFQKHLGDKKDDGYYVCWGEKKLKFGWSSSYLKDFMSSGENRDPFNCPIPEQIRLIEKERNLFYFEDYVTVFKNEIEIREDSNALKKIINSLWENELSYDFQVKTEGVEGYSFFTDVAIFKEVIKLIFRNFKSRPEFPNINIRVEKEHGNIILIKLAQLESKCRRIIDDPKIISPDGGDLGTIIKSMKGLADFSISAIFPDNKNYRVNYLASNNLVELIERIEFTDGFTYELKFYL